MDKFELVVKKWTVIGEHGFQYYWDPAWLDPVTGCKEIHYMNPTAGYARQVSLNQDDTLGFLEWLVPTAYKEVETTWLRTTNGLGKRG